MMSYTVRGLFKTAWVWFGDPRDIPNVSEAVFFSYNDVSVSGFKQKAGLTTVVDISKDEREVWEGFRKKFVREQIRRGEDAGIRVRRGTLGEFEFLYRSFRSRKGIPESNVSTIAEHGVILVAVLSGAPIAGGLFIADAEHARAFALCSVRLDTLSGRDRERAGFANRMVVWEAMRHFKRAGVRTFDLGGLESGDTEQRRSFNEFKEAFGGKRVSNFYYKKTYSVMLRTIRRIQRLI